MFRLLLGSVSNGIQEVQVQAVDEGARVTWPDGREAAVSWEWVEDHTPTASTWDDEADKT